LSIRASELFSYDRDRWKQQYRKRYRFIEDFWWVPDLDDDIGDDARAPPLVGNTLMDGRVIEKQTQDKVTT
jgi:hypothetical protein